MTDPTPIDGLIPAALILAALAFLVLVGLWLDRYRPTIGSRILPTPDYLAPFRGRTPDMQEYAERADALRPVTIDDFDLEDK